ncbi:transketolase-like TK C-terminal-containing protein, partial [Anaerotalea alkaliphila]
LGLDRELEGACPAGAQATRVSSHGVLNRLAEKVPNLIGGAADLAPSTKTTMEGRGHFTPGDHGGANLHFGVREHAMAAMANGIALHGGLIPYVAGFFVFSDYMKPAMRLSALMGLPVTYVFTHDSIGVGEDGPTHQPIEHLAMLRGIPNFNTIRPADYRETEAAWRVALSSASTPTALVLSRQNLPQYEGSGEGLYKGAYILKEASGRPKVVLIGTGSEVELVWKAARELEERGIPARVVSMPSWHLFDAQPESYRREILPDGVPVLAVEAGTPLGWHKYTGAKGKVMGIGTFGMSGPAEEIYGEMGLTVGAVVEQASGLLEDTQRMG